MANILGLENLNQFQKYENPIQEEARSSQSSIQSPVSGAPTEGSFGKIFEDSIQSVNQMQHNADQAIKELVAGRTKNIHETLLTIEKAETSLKLMMQVRNKIIEAYKEIMRMQV